MKYCEDCGPSQEIHSIAYLVVVLGLIDEPFFFLMEKLFRNISEAIEERATMPFFKLMVNLRIGYFSEKPDEEDSWRTKCLWDEAARRGIKMKEFHLGPIRDGFVAEFRGKTIIFKGLPRPGLHSSNSLYWMDDKGIMKEKFKKEGLPIADGGVAWSAKGALKIFNRIQKPVITKPNLGSRSRHTTIHINTEEELIAGFKKARKLSPLVVIEEELRGHLFRVTLVGGKLVGTVKRDFPEVTGDGVSTLRALWEKENERPQRAGPIFHKITLGREAEAELKRQGVTMDSIPLTGQIVTFSQKTGRGAGGTTEEVTGTEHPENVEMLERIATFLDDPLIGVDFIIEDITKSWREQKSCGIIECNSLPFIDLHHYPLFGKPQNIAGKLWDLVMPESKI